jgi:hypothetical protein
MNPPLPDAAQLASPEAPIEHDAPAVTSPPPEAGPAREPECGGAPCSAQDGGLNGSAAGHAANLPAPADAAADAADVAEDDAGTVRARDQDGKVGPNGRPVGVAECYSAASSGHAATQRHWQVFRSGDLEARGDMIDELSAAVQAQPAEQEFALLLGLASLWRVAEPFGLEELDPFVTLESIEAAQSELERAYALCPTDHRIPAWLGPIKIRMGRMLEDPALVDEGFAVLNKGIEHYPGFVLFAKLLVYADLPATDPEFSKAVDAVRDNAAYCGTVASGLSADPACHNHPRASHNIEGSAVFLGDMYAKAQDRAAALAAYQSAKAAPTWNDWDYRSLLEERITTLDARMAALASPDTADDLEPAWVSQIQCSLCHRE